MKCDVDVLEDFVEGFLDETTEQKIEQHMQHCEYCKHKYMQLVQEQNMLTAQLNFPMRTHSQADLIMQRLQGDEKRKKSWQSFQLMFISAAVLLLSFALYYWNQPPQEMVEPMKGEPNQVIATNNDKQQVASETKPATNDDEPMLKVSIDEVVENGENTEIHYRVKFNESFQQQQNELYQQIRTRYQYKDVDYSKIDPKLDDFFGSVHTSVKFAIRDEAGQLIVATKRIEGETPVINDFGGSSGNTDILGEWIHTTSVPTNTKPATFEVLEMQANVFDLYEAEIDPTARQPFQFDGVTYELESVELKQKTLHIQLATDGEAEINRRNWQLVVDDQLYFGKKQETHLINNRTVYFIEFEGLSEMPNPFNLVPSTAFLKQEIEPIVLDLRK